MQQLPSPELVGFLLSPGCAWCAVEGSAEPDGLHPEAESSPVAHHRGNAAFLSGSSSFSFLLLLGGLAVRGLLLPCLASAFGGLCPLRLAVMGCMSRGHVGGEGHPGAGISAWHSNLSPSRCARGLWGAVSGVCLWKLSSHRLDHRVWLLRFRARQQPVLSAFAELGGSLGVAGSLLLSFLCQPIP